MNASLAGLAWRNHFRRNLFDELHPPEHDTWDEAHRGLIGPSLAQFQLGESSDGRHLLSYARRFGDRTGDAWFGEATALFIQEENRHSHWLGEFLKAQHYPLLKAHWVDGIFRFVRKLMGYGLMVSVLVCAEIVAVPYYAAVRRLTSSQWLRAICTRILRDEDMHLRFQAGNLGRAWPHTSLQPLLQIAHQAMMLVICAVVWKEHGRLMRASGLSFIEFAGQCRDLLTGVHRQAVVIQLNAWQTKASPAARY